MIFNYCNCFGGNIMSRGNLGREGAVVDSL